MNTVSKKTIGEYCIKLVAAFVSTFALCIVTEIRVRNIVSLIFFGGIAYLYCRLPKVNKHVFLSVASAIITCAYCVAKHDAYTAEFTNKGFVFLQLAVLIVGLFIFLRVLLECIYNLTADGKLEKAIKSDATCKESIIIGAVSAAVILVATLPYFLYEYPGIMSPDGLWQFEQAVGHLPLNNHHPVAHTLFMRLCMGIGRLFSANPNIRLGTYTFIQMVLMALTEGFSIGYTRKKGYRVWVCILMLLFLALVPFNLVYNVFIGKDTLFAGAGLLLVVLLWEMKDRISKNEKVLPDGAFYPLFVIISVVFCLFRTNGYFAFAGFCALVIIVALLVKKYRKNIVKALILFALPLVISALIKGPVYKAMNIEPVDFVESVCIPLQQVGRVVAADIYTDRFGNARISDKDKELINQVAPYELVGEIYTTDFADSLKELVRVTGDQEYLVAHKKEFFGLWLRLMPKNLGIYIDAWRDVTIGFWFPDYSYDTASIDGMSENSAGAHWQPLLGTKFMKIKEISLKLGDFVPVLGLLFASGTYSMLMIVKACMKCEKVFGEKDKHLEELMPVLLPAAVLGTILIAAPIAAEFRYTYMIVLSWPLWLLI